MNLLGIEFSLSRRAVEVFLAGCNTPHCGGCHLPESWDFNAGVPFSQEELDKILEYADTGLVDRFMVMGGEPLHQNTEDLTSLLQALFNTGKEVWLFTRHDIKDIPTSIYELIHYVKTGPYIPDMTVKGYMQHGVELASANQKIIRVSKDFS